MKKTYVCPICNRNFETEKLRLMCPTCGKSYDQSFDTIDVFSAMEWAAKKARYFEHLRALEATRGKVLLDLEHAQAIDDFLGSSVVAHQKSRLIPRAARTLHRLIKREQEYAEARRRGFRAPATPISPKNRRP